MDLVAILGVIAIVLGILGLIGLIGTGLVAEIILIVVGLLILGYGARGRFIR